MLSKRLGNRMMPTGSVNTWICNKCGFWIAAIHKDYGVTPMFLACKGKKCTGRMASSMYPPMDTLPEHVRANILWEWYMPTDVEARELDRAMLDHVQNGGLLLRPIQ